ncbi:hypothetical protein [Ideonella paludis]|uniref:hypothetical protein n=1 Tax=Ideonella paludis TaxID=1233411 RepID=UPI0028732BD5|nr:hypothetical protein [Ideonella paludis]
MFLLISQNIWLQRVKHIVSPTACPLKSGEAVTKFARCTSGVVKAMWDWAQRHTREAPLSTMLRCTISTQTSIAIPLFQTAACRLKCWRSALQNAALNCGHSLTMMKSAVFPQPGRPAKLMV